MRPKVAGVATQAYVEHLMVLDISIYNLFQTFMNTTDRDWIYQTIRIYYSHVNNGVS